MTSLYYTPSGHLPFAGLPVLAIGVIGAIPGAWIYGWLSWHLVFWLDILAVGAFAVYASPLAKRRRETPERWLGLGY